MPTTAAGPRAVRQVTELRRKQQGIALARDVERDRQLIEAAEARAMYHDKVSDATDDQDGNYGITALGQ